MNPRTLTKDPAPAKRCGRPAAKQATERTLIDILIDPTEKLAHDDAKAAADQKDALVYAAMRRLKEADEAKAKVEAEKRARCQTAALAPVIRATAAIAKLPRTCGGFAIKDNGVIVTLPSGLMAGLCYVDSGSDEKPIRRTGSGESYAMTVEEAVEWLLRTAISFGVQLPQE